ncbi:MAG TPA: MFS transporter, partial [Hyphomicrobiaceae bacterium]|nr:MFS transporter [Hyphomicrobiaceae bacterium]
RPFFGWRVVAAAFVLAAFGWGVGFYGPPIYLHAVVERTGWPVALVSGAVTAHFLVGVPVVANMPRLYRRFGIPLVTGVGAVLLAAGVVGWAIAREPWQLFAAAGFSGVGWVTLGAAAVNALVAQWFVRARPAALAMAYNGASIGGVVFSPLWVALIAALGFAGGASVIGLVMVAVIGALSHMVFSRTPESMGQVADGDAPGASAANVTSPRAHPLPGSALWTDGPFRTLAAGMALSLFAQIGLIAHLYSLLVPAIGKGGAGAAMGFATVCAIAGRTIVGWTMPAGADRRHVAAMNLAVQVAGSVALLASGGTSVPLLLAGVALFGAGIGNVTSLPPLIAQVEFVKEDAARVVPLIVAIGQATYAFAPAALGLLRSLETGVALLDHAGAPLYLAAAIVQLAACACFLASRR